MLIPPKRIWSRFTYTANMSAAAGTSMLNYNSKRQPALSATMERVKIPPQNGTIFAMGSTIDIRLPNMPHGNFLDFHNSYLKLNIETSVSVTGVQPQTLNEAGAEVSAKVPANVAAADRLFLPQNGVYGGLIQRVEIISAAQTISVLDEYSKLTNLFNTSSTTSRGNVHIFFTGVDFLITWTCEMTLKPIPV